MCHTGFTPFYPKGVGWVQSRRARRCTSTERAKSRVSVHGTRRAACAGAKALHQVCASVGRRAKRGGQKMHSCTTTCTACRRRRRKPCSSAAAPGAVHECELSRLEACRVCTELAQGRAPTRRFALQGACRGAEVCAKGVQGVRRACTSWGTGCAVVEVALHVCAQLCAEDA